MAKTVQPTLAQKKFLEAWGIDPPPSKAACRRSIKTSIEVMTQRASHEEGYRPHPFKALVRRHDRKRPSYLSFGYLEKLEDV